LECPSLKNIVFINLKSDKNSSTLTGQRKIPRTGDKKPLKIAKDLQTHLIEWGKIRPVRLIQRVNVLVLVVAVLVLSNVHAAFEVVGIRAGANAEQNQCCDNRKENSDDQRV
jgi:predicted Holliday junction resolvase-like endonuclease